MNRMFIGRLTLALMIAVAPVVSIANPKTPVAAAADNCPVSLDLSIDEANALLGFNANLGKLRRYYGTARFQTELSKVITTEWPTKKVIDFSPTFLEKTLALIDQQYLRHSIAETIGLNSPDWQAFDKVMMRVTLETGLTENRFGAFTRLNERLMTSIKSVAVGQLKSGAAVDQPGLEVIKARAVSRLTTMSGHLQKWSIINREISKQRARESGAVLTMAGLGLSAGAIMGASLLYSGVFLDAVTAYGAGLSSNATASMILSRSLQTVAVGALAGAGTPVGHFLMDMRQAHLDASDNARFNHSLYVCELDKQIKTWKKTAPSLYFRDVLLGFSIGVGGTLITFVPTFGGQFVLWTSSGLVLVSQIKPAMDTVLDHLEAEKERRLAMKAFFVDGNRQEAIAHLKRSHQLASQSQQDFLQVIVMATLTHAFSAHFKTALLEGDRIVRALFANSADTLPQAANIAMDAANGKPDASP